MNRVLSSDFIRLRKSKVFFGCIIGISLYCIWVCVNQYITLKRYQQNQSLDVYLFCPVMLIGLLISIFCSLFVGTEYSDGVIRNKIVVGHSRMRIYFSHFITCFVAGTIIFLIGSLIIFLIGSFIFDSMKMPVYQFVLIAIDCIILNMAYAAIFNLISMLIPSKAHASIANIVIFLLLLFVGIWLYQALKQPEMIQEAELTVNGEIMLHMAENPNYLTGMKREIYQFFEDFLPGGQTSQILNFDILHPYQMAIYSAIITVICNGIGIFFFRKKDIK